MALVRLNLGYEFATTKVCKLAKRCLPFSLGEISFTFIFVSVGLLIFGCTGSQALLFDSLAFASARSPPFWL
ncbi:MAG: hypothetical protein CMM01_20670 [Rhodopirellula sp.]|nr:hypothetical protein [Rhodopirellula sp.]MAI73298.1 hypothetical protein [Rhodopirellula sp.]OUX50371.1 MAG: hypothetical protein CBE43_06575 [Rhodopirellula sp. TMED283]